uniref:Uncharacterized protein AlNc14C92G5733 n=1 Tax=Albugo laibachii Nc14 TaxID=890382 RepID=F0WGK5_9STRA|nr:conserved hypothetical protein [Albugo laibachii Nc14]|eukprot:CCA20369.1 conserved hypothetical protein [Albugo laibachii Nc14]
MEDKASPSKTTPPSNRSTGATCMYYGLEIGAACRKPRTCFDCLNAVAERELEGCVLTSNGICKSIAAYIPQLDYRRIRDRTYPSVTYFPSVNSTYCVANDPACVECAVANKTSKFTYCVGSAGCVCVQHCQDPDWESSIGDLCVVDGDQLFPAKSQNNNYHFFILLFMVIQTVLLLVLFYRRMSCFRRYRRRAQAEGPYNNVNAISSPSNRLQLVGWRQLQQNLIQKEKKERQRSKSGKQTCPSTYITTLTTNEIRGMEVEEPIDVTEYHIQSDRNHTISF